MSDKTYRFERFSEMPERGTKTLFDNCFFQGLDLKPVDGDMYERCGLVGGSLILEPGIYDLGDFTLENASLITSAINQDKGRVGVARAQYRILVNGRTSTIDMYNVDVTHALSAI